MIIFSLHFHRGSFRISVHHPLTEFVFLSIQYRLTFDVDILTRDVDILSFDVDFDIDIRSNTIKNYQNDYLTSYRC